MVPPPEESLGWQRPLLAMVLGTVFAVCILEVAARLRPLERVQTIDLSVVSGEVVDGVPTWRASDSTDTRMGTPCTTQPEVVLVGSSIFWGSGVEDSESLRPQLAAQLPDACVRSVAQPAYTFANQAADLSRHLETAQPTVVVWEIWRNSPNAWTVLDGVAYNFGGDARHLDDLPIPGGLPAPTHRALFSWSAAYRHLVITHVEPSGISWLNGWSTFIDDALTPWVDRLIAQDTHVVLALMPALHEPFEAAAAAPQSAYPNVTTALGDRVTVVPVAAELSARGVDVEAARADLCCHYSPEGNSELSVVVARAVQGLLAPVPEPSPDTP